MNLILIGLGVLLAVVVAALLIRRAGAGGGPPPRAQAAAVAVDPAPDHAPSSARDGASAVPRAVEPIPPELAGFVFLRADEVPADRRQALVAALQGIRQPPRSLHQLLDPDFVNDSSSAQLSDLVMGEPLIAAKVLAAVNSPLYGLQKPVASIGQAVTFLGLNTVRGICLQYMLDDSFKADSPDVKTSYDTIWNASAFASEICFRLAQKLRLPDQGALVTQTVLSFFGHLAAPLLMPRDAAISVVTRGLLVRTNAEQERLGLAAAEIGGLLMQQWALPAGVIDDARDVDRILVTPAAAGDGQRGTRLAVCYLCARLGEKLALDDVDDLKSFDPATDPAAEFFHLRGYLERPALQRTVEYLHAPEMVGHVHRMKGATTARR